MINLLKAIKNICSPSLLVALLIASPGASASESHATASCCQQSGTKQSNLVELPAEAIQKLKIDAGFGWGIFSGTIYNDNDNYHLTQLVIRMTPKHDEHHTHMHAHMSHEPRVHQINLDLPPATKGALSMALPNDVADVHDFKWEILKATGYQVR